MVEVPFFKSVVDSGMRTPEVSPVVALGVGGGGAAGRRVASGWGRSAVLGVGLGWTLVGMRISLGLGAASALGLAGSALSFGWLGRGWRWGGGDAGLVAREDGVFFWGLARGEGEGADHGGLDGAGEGVLVAPVVAAGEVDVGVADDSADDEGVEDEGEGEAAGDGLSGGGGAGWEGTPGAAVGRVSSTGGRQ